MASLINRNTRTYAWIVVALLWIVGMLNYMDRQMLSTMRESIMIDISELESAANFGRLMAVFLWVYGIMSPFSGIIGDRISRKWVIVSALFVWSFVTFMMGYATSFSQLYILRGIMGVSEALYMPAALSLIADYHRERTRSLAIGINMTGIYFGQAMGGFGATLAVMYGWHGTFHSFGLIGIAYSVVLMFLLYDTPRHIGAVKTEEKKRLPVFKGMAMLLANVSFWVILFYFCVPSVPGWATKNWLPSLFASSLGIDMEVAGPIATISIAVSSFAGVLLGGFISDRWVMRNVRGRIYTAAIGLSLMIPALLCIGYGYTLLPVVAGAVLFGVGFGFFDANNMPIVCQFVSSRSRATAYGIMNMCSVFAGAAVTDLLGRSMDTGNLGRDFAMLSILVTFTIIVILTCLRPTTVDMSDSDASSSTADRSGCRQHA
ncbi:MFS transporter [Muribaculum intestinale]|uniref:MFS transporter n=1 Tax=Muribaculum intestinale TaxID=1796646 RepID=UPI0025B53E30|nr:MFS transporter [Muribaculum intestinale]